MATLKHLRTAALDIAYEESGAPDGIPVVLLHGFPYDVRAYDDVVPPLVAAGYRTLVPYLRGFGPTRLIAATAMKTGQQAALADDLLGFLDGLALPGAVLAGYDWGGRAACIVAALWPERVRGLVSVGGYNLQDIAGSVVPLAPEQEHRFWYQYYFHGERGRAGLTANRHALCRLLWTLWSPGWAFTEATYAATAASFDNPDFVDVVIHSYRHRFGYAAGDPDLADIEHRVAAQPAIAVPTVVLDGDDDGVGPAEMSAEDGRHFTGRYRREVIAGAGHNLPQEAPDAVVKAICSLL
ncbi:MAG: alpha/beta hydrolase [Azospirillaceae bacterium]|nr:alpha/beta hydrolase [Azospirillaceae bacterium]